MKNKPIIYGAFILLIILAGVAVWMFGGKGEINTITTEGKTWTTIENNGNVVSCISDNECNQFINSINYPIEIKNKISVRCKNTKCEYLLK